MKYRHDFFGGTDSAMPCPGCSSSIVAFYRPHADTLQAVCVPCSRQRGEWLSDADDTQAMKRELIANEGGAR